MDVTNLAIGDYKITSIFEQKRFFPKVKRFNPETGQFEVKSIPVKRVRRVVILTHISGDIVQFVAYLHKGCVKFKDSRSKFGVSIPASVCYEELQRMLKCNHLVAEDLMAF